jgi:hypothetical protein
MEAHSRLRALGDHAVAKKAQPQKVSETFAALLHK